MIYDIKYAYACHTGKVRANNEDNFWCCGRQLPAENQGLEGFCSGSCSRDGLPALAVFDGMGGESCGERAAFLAAEAFGRYYGENRKALRWLPARFLQDACRSMNQAVLSYGAENRIRSMGTTLAMVAFGRRSVFACNLGDSRIYYIYEGTLRQISTDHVLRGSLIGKAPLTQYLGLEEDGMALEPSLVKMPYCPGSRYLLCSDGVTDMLTDRELSDILGREAPVEKTVELLMESAMKKGGRDNVTIVLCEVTAREEKRQLPSWLRLQRKPESEKSAVTCYQNRFTDAGR